MVREWTIASKAILPLPNLHNELSEESRVRSRYLDLIARDQARLNVVNRSKVVASLRKTFADRGYIEVETPMLQVMHGGASARPFVTHSNAFDTELFLRIAPELYLKRAVVGGIDRVFEINRNFRNEGADSTHSPEFAMLESYEAYGDYNVIAELTQTLVQNAAFDIAGSHTVTWADGTEYDLGGEWDRIRMYDSLSEAVGEEITPATPVEDLRAIAAREGIEIEHPLPRQVRRGAVGALRQGHPRAPDVRDGLPGRHQPARACPPLARRRRREVGPVRARLRARDRLLRADRPGRAARAVHRAGEARCRRRRGGDASRRGVPACARVRHAADRRPREWASTAC